MKLKLNYLIIPAIILLIAFTGKFLTESGMNWYHTISLPDLAPPGWFIGIVWQIIYVMVAASLLIVWNRLRGARHFWTIIAFFVCNGILNLAWSFCFFYNQSIQPAIGISAGIAATVGILIALIWPLNKLAASLLIPYFCWVSFATYLNVLIAQLN
jgi:tryptophan-rich sensory protein